ncbi:MAG: C4-dicarboxylate ABC transporter permease [Alphaproteobacteria bacterium]|nr:MAG: C4-dicarboxylate ABC transporter permease [Alphaproteobacteria bacterium]
MLDFIVWVLAGIAGSFVDVVQALLHPAAWLSWIDGFDSPEDKKALMRFVYYGASKELFFVVLTAILIVTGIGMWRRPFLWRVLGVLEGIGNTVGRTAAWAGLVMVLQQIMIVFLQRIFRVSEISIGPFGYVFTKDLSWYAEELKFYNAIVVTLCLAYTFIQGGHVRVDLVYAGVGYRAKKAIDMFGSLFFMLPMATLLWLYSWFFLWRHLIVPNPSASDALDKLLLKSRALRWNVETIGFSPNGFNAYFLFKVLLVLMVAMIFLQGLAFFYRSWLEFVEGPEAEGRNLDHDRNEDPAAEMPGEGL